MTSCLRSAIRVLGLFALLGLVAAPGRSFNPANWCGTYAWPPGNCTGAPIGQGSQTSCSSCPLTCGSELWDAYWEVTRDLWYFEGPCMMCGAVEDLDCCVILIPDVQCFPSGGGPKH